MIKYAIAFIAVVIIFLTGCTGPASKSFSPWDWAQNKQLYEYNHVEIDFNDPVLLQRKIVVSNYICPATSGEVVSKLLFLDAKENKPIDLILNTNGGWYDDAMAISDAMHLIKSPVNVRAMGCCRSEGILVLLGATGKRCATPNTILQIHANLGDTAKPYTDGYIDVKYRIEKLFREKTKLPLDWYPLSSGAYYSMTPDEAIRFGIIDEIVKDPQ